METIEPGEEALTKHEFILQYIQQLKIGKKYRYAPLPKRCTSVKGLPTAP